MLLAHLTFFRKSSILNQEDTVCGILYNDIPYYFYKNLQGDIIAIADQNGKVVAKYDYDAWGVCTITEDISDCSIATVNPYRYRGYYFDNEIGMYYLQSRYYDARVGRFINGDDLAFLGLGSPTISHNIYTYCENDPINYVDYFGHTPSLSTLTRMHNAVVSSARNFLLTVGIIASTEIKTCNYWGTYNGRMDIYSYTSNKVWEVKRNNLAGISAGLSQLRGYTSSYVYSLYHSWFRQRKMPRYGNKYVYGCTVVSNYLVTYHSYSSTNALIVYDYMTLQTAGELLYNAVIATSSSLIKKASAKVKPKLQEAFAQISRVISNFKSNAQKCKKAIIDFLKIAGPWILTIIALIIFVATGVPVIA